MMNKRGVFRITAFLLTVLTAFSLTAFSGYQEETAAAAQGYPVWVDFTGGRVDRMNMNFVDSSNQNDEPYTYISTKAGISCRIIPNNKYAYFQADTGQIDSNDRDLFIEVTFFDEGSGSFQIHYNTIYDGNLSSNYKQASITKTNTNTWITTTVCLSDASFRHAQNNNADFRITGGGSAGTAIASVKVKKEAVDLSSAGNFGERTGGSSYSEFIGKSVTGYQAWFTTGGQFDQWSHWGGGSAEPDGTSWPRPGKISFDVYPDISDYSGDVLAQTGFADLGSGAPAELFDSNASEVIETHFGWMEEYGIDGAAIQRFSGGLTGRNFTTNPDNATLMKIKNAAEDTGRIFYIMYDISGGIESSYVDDIKFDWIYNIERNYELLNSPSYATVNGKPVVCVWGLGVDGRPSDAAKYQELLDFFKSRDCYFIAGTAREWRQQGQYAGIFNQCDMISPWLVGAFGDDNSMNSIYSNFIAPDLTYCNQRDIDYYPVIFSGFSWTLWNNGKPNMIPRNAGQFFWSQAYKLKQMGVDAFYIAMFDEYDEGTGIMKNASDYFDIPTNQYFVTASADGYWLSPDFQLRTAGAAIEMIKGERPAVPLVPVAHSAGPIYYRNSFESMYVNSKEVQYSGIYPVDPGFKNPAQLSVSGVSGQSTAIQQTNRTVSGAYAARFGGNASGSGSSYYYKIADVKIQVKQGMELSFSKYAVNDQGRYTNVSLLFSDGTMLHNLNVSDTDGRNMRPSNARGTIGAWEQTTCVIGTDALAGKSITGILFGYEGTAAGSFEAYFDNLLIQYGEGDDDGGGGTQPGNQVLAEIDFSFDQVFTGDFAVSQQFPSINVSAYNKDYLYLVMDVTAEDLGNPGDASILNRALGQIELTSQGIPDQEEMDWMVHQQDWRAGQSTIYLPFAASGNTNGDLDLSGINFMRFYANTFPSDFSGRLRLRVENVRIMYIVE